jgi:hypothetical protein
MAVPPTGTFTTVDAIGEAEDVADIIYDISPTETPFLTSAKKGTASNVLHQWQTDALASANKDNASAEGMDATTSTASPTVMYSNYCQILQKTPRVSGTLRKVKTYGRADDMSREIVRRGKELKRDLESALLSGNGATAGSATNARKLAGVGAWLWGNVEAIGGSTATTVTMSSGTPVTDVVHASTGAAPTEGNLKTLLEAIWNDGGDPSVVMADGTNKKAISAFSGIATQYRENTGVSQATILGAADLYISDFGEVSIVANRFCDTQSIYALDMDYWSVDYLRSMQTTPLAKTGDSDRSQLLCEVTLMASNPNASGKIYSTT